MCLSYTLPHFISFINTKQLYTEGIWFPIVCWNELLSNATDRGGWLRGVIHLKLTRGTNKLTSNCSYALSDIVVHQDLTILLCLSNEMVTFYAFMNLMKHLSNFILKQTI